MRRKFIVWLCILALLVVCTGCNKNNKSNNNNTESNPVSTTDSDKQGDTADADQTGDSKEGSYSENVLTLPDLAPEEYSFGCRVNDNHYEIFTTQRAEDGESSLISCYTLEEDGFHKSPVDWATKASKELKINPRYLCQSEDGNDYILFMKRLKVDAQDKIACVLVKKSEDGKGYTDITLPEWKDAESKIPSFVGACVSNIGVTKDQIMYYVVTGDNLELEFYDLKENKKLDYGSFSTVSDAVLKDNKLYLIELGTNQIQILDMNTKQSEAVSLPATNNQLNSQFLQVTANDEIVLSDKTGIYLTKDQGTTWDTIVDGYENSMSIPTYVMQSFISVQGASTLYYITYDSMIEGKGELFTCYEPSKAGENVATKKLTICSLYDNLSIREMISYFKTMHPEVRISYQVLFSSEGSETKSDIIRTLNTELLAGKGADIILVDDLPLSDYIDKGVFMDISDIFSTPGKERPLLKNIADYYKKDGKIYCMPMRVLLPLYGMHEDITNNTKTVEDLAAYCEGNGTPLLETYTYDQVAKLFLVNYSNEIFTEDGMIDKDGLTSFLGSLNTIAKQIGSSSTMKAGWYSGNTYAMDRLQEFYLGYEDTLMWKDYTLIMTDCIGSSYELQHLAGVIRTLKGTYASMNNSFAPNGIIGINQNAKEPELAKEFVGCLFDDKMQSMDLMDGFPVNEDSFNNFIKVESISRQDMYLKQDNSFGDFEDTGITEAEKQYFDNCMKSLTRPIYTEDSGSTIIMEGAVAYLSGEKTLDQAVNDIMQKANLLFAE